MKTDNLKKTVQKIVDTLSSRSAIAAFLFAVSLWGYTSLNEKYTTRINIPLEVQLPNDRALEESLPDDISLEVKGSGWHLFNIFFFNTSENCFIDLSKKRITDSIYTISRTDILKGVRNLMNLEATDVLPEYMQLITGKITEKEVPVYPDLEVIPRDGFITAEAVKVQPRKVMIRGNDKIIKNVNSWQTARRTMKDVYTDINIKVPLKDTLGGIVDLIPNQVRLASRVEQFAEVTIYDVPVRVTGGVLSKEHTLSAKKIDITVRAAASILDNLTADKFTVTLNYRDILTDSTGIVLPKIESRDKLVILKSHPEVIYHYKRFKESLIAGR